MHKIWGFSLFFFAFTFVGSHVQAGHASTAKKRGKRFTAKHIGNRKARARKSKLRPSWRQMLARSRKRQERKNKKRRTIKNRKQRRGLFVSQSTLRARRLRLAMAQQAQSNLVQLPSSLPPRQDANYPVRRLSEMYNRVKRSNLDLRILRQRIVQVELIRAKSWAILKPQLSLGASFIRSDNETRFGDSVLTPQNQIAAQLKLQWAVLNLTAIPALQAAYLSLKQVKQSAKQAKREVLYGTARAYYGVLLADGLMQISKQTWNNAKEHLRISNARLKAGVTPELAVTRAQLDLAKAWQSRIQAENGLRNARLALALLINQSNLSMRPVRPSAPTLPAGNYRDWRRQALRRRSEIKAARIAVKIAHKSVTQQWMKYLPTVAVAGQVQGTNAGGFNNRNFSWSVTVAAQMNLYSGGTRHIQVKEAYSKLQQARLELAKAIRKTENEVSQASVTINNAKVALQIARKQLQLAERTYQLTQARYKTGVATPVEVSDSMTALQSARIAVLREELSYELAILQLQRALGTFRP